ncbi:12067_t:CDS:2, partial [Racocetra persica]
VPYQGFCGHLSHVMKINIFYTVLSTHLNNFPCTIQNYNVSTEFKIIINTKRKFLSNLIIPHEILAERINLSPFTKGFRVGVSLKWDYKFLDFLWRNP